MDKSNSDSFDYEFCKGSSIQQFSGGPPMLNKSGNRVEGLAFIGLSLSRNHLNDQPLSNPLSVSRQTQYDFNQIQDRKYQYFCATNDDGWLVGGGENGESFKLSNPDSAHCEIIRIGTFNEDWGGVKLDTIIEVMTSGRVLIPHFNVLPSFVLVNKDSPPETELKFVLEKDISNEVDTWANWQFTFLMNQLFAEFENPGRFCPGPHHMTFVRKSAWRSIDHMKQYFQHCDEIVRAWRSLGPQYLEPETDANKAGYPTSAIDNELTEPHGVYLFKDRNTILRYFAPNFHPPYDTDEKRQIIHNILARSWDEGSLSWK